MDFIKKNITFASCEFSTVRDGCLTPVDNFEIRYIMEKNEFVRLENVCRRLFGEAGVCYHVCSQENHPVLFHSEKEFIVVMNVVALAAFMFPDLRIFTFAVMGNHLHFAFSGEESRIELFLKTLVSKLASHPELHSSASDLRKLSFKLFPIKDLENMRSVIAYINRNGAVVNPDESVYTYRWGANRFFFNRESSLRLESCGITPTLRKKREMFHSNFLAKERKIIVLDGYVSPACYCNIHDGELFFRNNRHYFYSVSRNIEASMEIAKIIGENIYYSDEDLFIHIMTICSKKYGCHSIAELTKEAKVEIAKDLHFNYNASNKQISRLLKIEISSISVMFPSK